MRSCLTRLADVAGKTVQTIEGLAGDVSTAVTQAWIKARRRNVATASRVL